MVLLIPGCGKPHFTFSVRDAITGEPMENVCVERHRDVGLFNHVFCPIAATYFPTYFDSSNRTDKVGRITYEGNPKRDRFVLHIPSDIPWDIPMYVQIGKIETKIHLTPKEIERFNEDNRINTGYRILISTKKGTLYFSPQTERCVDSTQENNDGQE